MFKLRNSLCMFILFFSSAVLASNHGYFPSFFTDDDSFDKQLKIQEKTAKKLKPKISIIVDDLGDNSIIAKKIILLPAPLTLAILPHTPFAKLISELGSQQDHEIIMHLPMEATSRPDLLGPGALFSNMTENNFQQTLLTSAQSIPNLIGLNNHMGSLLTQDIEKMGWLMSIAQQNNWYFLDSKTTEDSVALMEANRIGLPHIGRDVFLDHFSERANLPFMLEKQFKELKRIAKIRGHVVVICHPYPETFAFLTKKIPELNEDFELVHLSELLKKPNLIVAKKTN